MRPTSSFSPPQAQAQVAKPAAAPAKSTNFDDLWSLSLGGSTAAKPAAAGPNKSIKDLEKEKATAGLWGQQKPAGGVPPPAFGTFETARQRRPLAVLTTCCCEHLLRCSCGVDRPFPVTLPFLLLVVDAASCQLIDALYWA